MRLLGVLVVLLLPCTPVMAELAVCYDPVARPPGQQFHSGMYAPEQIAAEPRCTMITKASGQTENQLALIASTVERPLLTPTTQPATKYLKVVPNPPDPAGLAVLMTAAEMDSVDQAIANKQAPYDVANAEIKENAICKNHTLQEISAYWSGAAPTSQKSLLMAEVSKINTALANWETTIGLLPAGAPKNAMIEGKKTAEAQRDAYQVLATMYITHEEEAWRLTCSRLFVKP
jgi:hypothetical protein